MANLHGIKQMTHEQGGLAGSVNHSQLGAWLFGVTCGAHSDVCPTIRCDTLLSSGSPKETSAKY